MEIYIENRLVIKKEVLPSANGNYFGFASLNGHKDTYLFNCGPPPQLCPPGVSVPSILIPIFQEPPSSNIHVSQTVSDPVTDDKK